MQSDPPHTLAELELVHKNVSTEVDSCFNEHGDSHELRTMRIALLHIEERIQKLRTELQEGVQEINKEVADLNSAMQVGLQEVKKDVEKLNTVMQADLQELENELKDLRSNNTD
jgi:Skp family chaperone for outer membrane proteins